MKNQKITLEPADARKYGTELKGAARDGFAVITRTVENIKIDEFDEDILTGEIKYNGAIIPVESYDGAETWEAA